MKKIKIGIPRAMLYHRYGVLWKNHGDYTADKNNRRKKEGLLYMCFPSYCGPHLLWEHHLHVCAAKGELFIDP